MFHIHWVVISRVFLKENKKKIKYVLNPFFILSPIELASA